MLTITDVSSHFQGFLTFRLIFSIKEVNIWAIFPDLSPKLFFFFCFRVFAFNSAYLVVPAHFRPRFFFAKTKKQKKQGQWKVMLLFFVSFSVKDPAENKRRLSSLFSFHATSSLFPSFHHTPQNDAMIGL